ncbi:LytR/AlgR family response regulator transcription factor [Mucilaginibacter sp. X4EP1]|uniref:LytR/AlgR family response regulator transcription factor n=1 Tax=Mucilaginibacter sp. X4EP1 TaxID=2723092 RepID=UPI002168A65C|nr:LytTR family DNA-binding domain-containing protein [Mucilaginibacter sp. X4EP1]MCS3814537.1 DNA-binding LytR/AlgR family response regulator [Mucilaginibacter sp. X4EP1]
MIRCILVDDEPLALDLLEDSLKHVNYIQVVAQCRTASAAITLLQKEDIDLIFCDIQMAGLNGLQLVRSLIKRPMVIFVTAYEKFAIEGFELDVIDYLVKPVPLERFLKACYKAQIQFELRKKAPAEVVTRKNHFFIHADYNLIKINFSDVEYVEGLKDYVKVNLINQPKPILSRISIKSLQLQLPPGQFYRVHKSYIINIDHVLYIRRGKIITTNAELPLSDNYRDVIHKMTSDKME